MAIVRPFRALRPDPGKAPLVASPPYDVVNTKQARQLAAGNPLSFLHVVRPEIDLPDGTELSSEAVYQKASENLGKLIELKALVREESPTLYTYTQKMGDHEQTGLVACCSVDDYDADVIKKHEKTRKDKEDDRTRLILGSSAQTGPVFLMFRDDDTAAGLIRKASSGDPFLSFTAPDGVVHTVHRIDDESKIRAMVQAFAGICCLYVADGHHRSAAASRARAEQEKQNPQHTGNEDYNFFLTVIFPASSLQILPYNRVVKDVRGLSREDLEAKISDHFIIEESTVPEPAQKGEFGMFFEGRWQRLKYRQEGRETNDPLKSLDANILQDCFLGPILGIGDPRTDSRIDFVGGIHGAKELERRVSEGEAEIAFLLYPVSTEDIMRVSDANSTMPPKSTWFEPKLRSGLFVHTI